MRAMPFPGLFLAALLVLLPASLPAEDSTDLSARLDSIEAAYQVLANAAETLSAQGYSVDYPEADLATLAIFLEYTETDIADGNQDRAENALDEMADLVERCRRDLGLIRAGLGYGTVPLYRGDTVTIEGAHFRTTVQWPDGTASSDWPVVFNGYLGDIDGFTDRMADLAALKLSMVSVEIGPSWVLPDEDTIDYTEIDRLVEFLETAHQNGIAVNLLISPHYFPEWAWEKWPDIYINASEYCPYSVDAEAVREIMELYLDTLMPEIKDQPALVSLCLENEPAYFSADLDPLDRSRYSDWLSDEYGSVEAVSQAHGETYDTFDDVPLFYSYDWEVQPADGNPAAVYDYFRFNDQRFADWFDFLADLVHSHAPDLPVHVKVPDYVHVSPLDGIEPRQFKDFSQIAGNDCTKLYTGGTDDSDADTDGDEADATDAANAAYASDWVNENFFFDLLHAVYGMPLFNSEDHPVDDHEADFLPGSHIRNVLWQAAIHGQGASTAWVWGRDGVDEETGEADPDFTSILHQPGLVAEHARTGLDLMRLGREVAAFVDEPPAVALLYSPTSLMYTMHEDHERISYAAYEALNFTGVKIGFVSEADLGESGVPGDIQLLIAAGVSHLTDAARDGLRQFRENGGLIAVVGEDAFMYDAYGRSEEDPLTVDVAIPDLSAEALHPRILELAENLSQYSVRVVDPATGTSPWGVEWRVAEYDGRMLVNLTNYSQAAQTVRITGMPGGQLLDLITRAPLAPTMEIAPLGVKLIESVAADE